MTYPPVALAVRIHSNQSPEFPSKIGDFPTGENPLYASFIHHHRLPVEQLTTLFCSAAWPPSRARATQRARPDAPRRTPADRWDGPGGGRDGGPRRGERRFLSIFFLVLFAMASTPDVGADVEHVDVYCFHAVSSANAVPTATTPSVRM